MNIFERVNTNLNHLHHLHLHQLDCQHHHHRYRHVALRRSLKYTLREIRKQESRSSHLTKPLMLISSSASSSSSACSPPSTSLTSSCSPSSSSSSSYLCCNICILLPVPIAVVGVDVVTSHNLHNGHGYDADLVTVMISNEDDESSIASSLMMQCCEVKVLILNIILSMI